MLVAYGGEVDTHLGIARSLLQRWKEQRSSKPVDEVFPGHGRLAPKAQRIRDLEKQRGMAVRLGQRTADESQDRREKCLTDEKSTAYAPI